MLASRLVLRAILLASLLSLLVAVPGSASERKKGPKSPAKQVAAQPRGAPRAGHFTVSVETPPAAQPEQATAPAPAPPPPPLTLAQKPAVPPQVQYQNGQLTITAENSTLGDILRAVQKQTGTAIELPGGASERVVIHVGPAATHDVLVSLLEGSSFNYVMVGSPTDPNAVTRVVLSPKPGGGTEMASAGTPGQPPVPMASPQPFAGRNRVMEDAVPEAQADADNDDADDQPQAIEQPQADEQSPDQTGQQPGAPGVIKTPQQMLEELQRQQQQQQQIQQGIHGATPGQQPQGPQQQ